MNQLNMRATPQASVIFAPVANSLSTRVQAAARNVLQAEVPMRSEANYAMIAKLGAFRIPLGVVYQNIRKFFVL